MIQRIKESEKKHFLISVVIPVYNTEEYLDECMESVINQSLGFDKIQVILVNDGSTDNSSNMCEKYREKYPGNVVYISKENSGVSSARNAGLEVANADLITFLDGDDKWSENAFEIAYKAYKDNTDIKVYSCRMHFFDADDGEHQLNYKYTKDRTICIDEEYNYPQMSASSVFIENEVASKYRFDTNLKYSEDCKFINEILLDTRRMMVLSDPVYWYRKRLKESSAMQKSILDRDYYVPTCRYVYRYLMDSSIEKYGKVLRYIQYCVMYDLRWRLKIPFEKTGLSEHEFEEYVKLLTGLLQEIDDEIILEQKRIALALQLFALELKYGEAQTNRISCTEDGRITVDGTVFYDIKKQLLFRIDDAELRGGKVVISGQVDSPLNEEVLSLNYSINGKAHKLKTNRAEENVKTYLFGELKSNREFIIEEEIDYDYINELAFLVSCEGKSFDVRPRISGKKKSETKNRRTIFLSKGMVACISGDKLVVRKLGKMELMKEAIKRIRKQQRI